jgi:ABC-type lipoprotein export system ATPase subunit
MLATFDGAVADCRAKRDPLFAPEAGGEVRGAALSVSAVALGAEPRLLEGIDLDVRPGAQVALAGPPGAGKTALLEAMAGIRGVDAGSIRWNGVDLSYLPHPQREDWRRRTLGCMFRNVELFPAFDALRNVMLPATFGTWGAGPEERERAAALLERAGVRPTAWIDELSLAERARVSIVRALWQRPQAVLADEPIAHLEPRGAEAARRLLQQLCCEAGATLILATQNRDLAETFESTFVIRAGQLSRFVR